MDPYRKQELRLHGLVWTLLFALVPMVTYFHVARDSHLAFSWSMVAKDWLQMLPLLLLFLVHEFALTPLLKRRKGLYIGLTLVLLGVYTAFCLTVGWGHPGGPGGPGMPPHWSGADEAFPFRPDGPGGPPDGPRPLDPALMRIFIGILVIIANLGLKAFFDNLRGQQKLQRMEAERIQSQLETLRYQINPHFFMNTLNNIHALVDIDPEKAKESIVEFSRLMRHLLYEGDRPMIQLSEELDFLEHYISLMRLRYTDKVKIDFSRPEDCAGAEVPPLVFASFVENAFKHGVSYDSFSFIRVSAYLEKGKVVFRCANSRHGAPLPEGGLGMKNVRERLELLYGENYLLSVDESETVYDIFLTIPAHAETASH